MATFNFSYAPGTTLQQMIGFETAGRIWSSYLTDDVTINLHVGVSSSMPSGVIGGALPGVHADQQYASWRTQLAGDITSLDDQSANQHQQVNASQFTASIDGYKVGSNLSLNMTRANAKALGMLSGTDSALDGYIVFSQVLGSNLSWSYDYTRQGHATGNSLDFLSTAIHEIGHVLGFVSGLDKPGWLMEKTNEELYDDTPISRFYASLNGKLGHVTPLDMFRFSTKSVQQSAAVGDRWIDMSIGGTPYFSIDGGKTNLGNFSTTKNTRLGGDGQQASHWKHNTKSIMDPTLASSARAVVSTLDLQSMDAIGWNLAPNATTLTLDLSALVGQSQEALAQQLGQTVSWMTANATTAAQTIDQDLSQAVQTMVQDSQVYNWGKTWYNPYRQVVDMMSQQQIYTSFQTIDSLCPCLQCGQPTNASLSEAIASATSKTTGWLGSGQPEGQIQSRPHSLQAAPTHQTHHAIRQVVQAIIRNAGDLDRFDQDAMPPTLAATQVVAVSGMQPFNTGAEDSQSNEEQNSWAKRHRHYYNSVIRRYPEALQRSDNPQSFEESLEYI